MKRFHRSTRLRRSILAVTLVAATVIAPTPHAASAHHNSSDGLTPIVLFPAWHFTRLEVTVHNQHVDPNCPGSGTFEDTRLLRSRAHVLAGVPGRTAHLGL